MLLASKTDKSINESEDPDKSLQNQSYLILKKKNIHTREQDSIFNKMVLSREQNKKG